MNDRTAPILIQSGGKRYRIMNVSLGNDGSYYISFPKSNGYHVDKSANNQYLNAAYAERTIQLEEINGDFHCPKISFHPQRQTIHIKTDTGERFNGKEYGLFNFAGTSSEFLCPVLQVILPNDLRLFEEYNKTKYEHICYINDSRNVMDKAISLYLYIHTIGTIPDIKYISKGKTKYIWYTTMKTNAPFTFSIFYGEIDASSAQSQFMLCVNTKEEFLTITLS